VNDAGCHQAIFRHAVFLNRTSEDDPDRLEEIIQAVIISIDDALHDSARIRLESMVLVLLSQYKCRGMVL
jgi:hypothetical protein